jgi:hypothetical protein
LSYLCKSNVKENHQIGRQPPEERAGLFRQQERNGGVFGVHEKDSFQKVMAFSLYGHREERPWID